MKYSLRKGLLTALLMIIPISSNSIESNDLDYLVSLHCDNDVFLSAVGLNKKTCDDSFRKYSKECMNLISFVKPPIDINKSRKQTFAEGKILGYLYVMCIKASIYEEILNVPPEYRGTQEE